MVDSALEPSPPPPIPPSPPPISPPSSSNHPPPIRSYAKVTNPNSFSSSISIIFDESKITPIGSLEMVDGKPVLVFSDLETDHLASSLKFALVGKFSHGMPSAREIAHSLEGLKWE